MGSAARTTASKVVSALKEQAKEQLKESSTKASTKSTTSTTTRSDKDITAEELTDCTDLGFQAQLAVERHKQRKNVLRGEKAKTEASGHWATKQEFRRDRLKIEAETEKVNKDIASEEKAIAEDKLAATQVMGVLNQLDLAKTTAKKATKVTGDAKYVRRADQLIKTTNVSGLVDNVLTRTKSNTTVAGASK